MKKLLLVLLLVTAAATFQANSQTFFDPTTVYLVDYNPKKSVMVFRGNTPLIPTLAPYPAPTPPTPAQMVDFSGLHSAFKAQFKLQVPKGTFPKKYNFVDISLINWDSSENFPMEAASFINPPPLLPSSAQPLPMSTWQYTLPILIAKKTPSSIKTPPSFIPNFPSDMKSIALYLWPINPGTVCPPPPPPPAPPPPPSSEYVLPSDVNVVNTVNFADTLENLVDSATCTIFYVHCTSGRDRTGMATCAYLYSRYYDTWLATRKTQCAGQQQIPNQDIIDAVYIFGTTVRSDFVGMQEGNPQFDTPLEDLYTGQSIPALDPTVDPTLNFARLYPGPGGRLDYILTIEAIIGFIDPDTAPSEFPNPPLPPVPYFTNPPFTKVPNCFQGGAIGSSYYPWNFNPPTPPQPPPTRRKR